MSAGADYTAVLADLKARRDKLDAAIRAIEEIVQGGDVAAAPTGGNGEIASDAFFQMTVLDAAKKSLGMAKRPRGATAIAEALEQGGLTHRSKSLASTVYTTLKREDDRGGDVMKVGKEWGLAEWYPARPRKKVGEAATEPSDDKPSEPEQPSEQSMTAPLQSVS